MYFADDDRFWSQPLATASLREAGINSLRYPGGELADNYDWLQNRLVRPADWPGEPDDASARAMRTDYGEFLAHAQAAGVKDLFFVVNVDSAFHAPGNLDDNLLRYARSAAGWVVAVGKKTTGVTYWEIGNEPELPTSYPLSAEEYSKALNVFAREMRAVDPNIRIGAAGPLGVKSVGYGDRLTEGQRQLLRLKGGTTIRYCGRGQAQACRERLARLRPGVATNQPWWPVLLARAGSSFDFVAVHRYEQMKLSGQSALELTSLAGRLRGFSAAISGLAGRPVDVAVTEWNLPSAKVSGPATESEHLLNVAVQYGNLLVGGVAHAHYWPLQTTTANFRHLLGADGRLKVPGRLYVLLSAIRSGDRVWHAGVAPGVYVLGFAGDSSRGYFLVNATAKNVVLRLPEEVSDERFVRDGLVSRVDGGVESVAVCDIGFTGDVLRVEVPSRAFVQVLTTGDDVR